MLSYAPFPALRRYRVEVSGWNEAGNFFVENCDLLWTEGSGKQITLNRKLGRGAILFVRLLDGGLEPAERSHPVVYEAEPVGEGPNGKGQFRLSAVAPRLDAAERS